MRAPVWCHGRVTVDLAAYINGYRQPCLDVEEALERLRETGTGFIWLGLHEPDPAEFTQLARRLRLHPLAVEDALKGNQRAKIDFYDSSMFVALKTLHYIDATSDVETGELMILIGADFALSVRRGQAMALDAIRTGLEEQPGRLALGPMAVLHAIIDQTVDVYRQIDTELASDLDAIEDGVLGGAGNVEAADIYRLKREVLEFKRGAVPLVPPIQRLVNGDRRELVPGPLRPFFGDVLDHLLAVVEHAEAYDRLLTDILSAHLTQVSLQQNEDMRRISSWAAIAVVPTAIAGIYGMNFDNMPELRTQYGYFVVLGAIAVICLALYRAFRRSGWL